MSDEVSPLWALVGIGMLALTAKFGIVIGILMLIILGIGIGLMFSEAHDSSIITWENE